VTHSPHTAFIALGSNLDNPQRQCEQALEKIKNIPATEMVRTSSFYQSEPLVAQGADAVGVPSYVNAVCEIKTGLTADKLLEVLIGIETAMGREKRKKWESREIDLDILFYDEVIDESPKLTLPHPEIQNRSFVLEPLKEIAPDLSHPRLRKTVRELAEALQNPLKIERI